MPVNQDYQTVWPQFLREFTTPDELPVATVLASSSSAGWAALVPVLHVIGQTDDGTRGSTMCGAYTILGAAGSVALRVAAENTLQFGLGGLGMSVGIVARDLVLTATGLRGVPIRWVAFWQVLEAPAPP